MTLVALATFALLGSPQNRVSATPAEMGKVKIYVRKEGVRNYTDTKLNGWVYFFLYNDSDETFVNPKFKGVMKSGSDSAEGKYLKTSLTSMYQGSFSGVIPPRVWTAAAVDFEFPIRLFTYGRVTTIDMLSLEKPDPKAPLTDPIALRAFIQKSTPAVLASAFKKTPSLASVKDEAGMGPMAMAILSGSVQKVKTLEEAGLSLKIDSKAGVNALHLACQTSPDMIGYVRGKGIPWANDASNFSPLGYAMFSFRPQNIEALKPTKAQLNEGFGPYGATILHEAVSQGYAQVIKMLLKMGSDPNKLDNRGQPPVIYGFELDAKKYAETIKELNPDLKVRLAKQKFTLLQWAVMSDKIEAVKCFLSLGMSPYEKNAEGKDSFDLLGYIQHPVNRRFVEEALKTFKK